MFGRGKLRDERTLDPVAGTPRGRLSGQHVAPPRAAATGAHYQGTVTGWAPLPGTSDPSKQIGAFRGQLLNQYPALIPGVQLHSGREWGNSRWYYPLITAAPLANNQQTVRPQNIAGGQRMGSIYSGPNGPIQAQALHRQVAIAQVRQSGMAALDWAAALTDQ